MSVESFALNSVITGLVAALRDADGFQPPTFDGTDVPVYDGAIVSQASSHRCVVIGSNGDRNSVQQPAQFNSEWHDLDLTMRESGLVTCAVVVWAGDANPDTLADQRGDAVGILQDVDQAIRSSVSAAQFDVTTLLWSKINGAELTQGPTDRGTITRLAFTFSYEALLQVT